jgi:peroxiredoxin
MRRSHRTFQAEEGPVRLSRTEPSGDRIAPTRYDWCLLILLLLSLAGNAAAALKIVSVSKAIPAAAKAVPVLPNTGQKMPALEVAGLDGVKRTLLADGERKKPTVIYVFSPRCTWCRRNRANLAAMVRSAAARGYDVVGISLAPVTHEYLNTEAINFPVYVDPSERTSQAYELGPTPQTFVVSSERVLENAWSGAYVGQTKREVEAWLRAELPGLVSTTTLRDNTPGNN